VALTANSTSRTPVFVVAIAAMAATLLVSSPRASAAPTEAQAPLIEAEKTPTRVRPSVPAETTPKAAPPMALPVHDIPTMPKIVPPEDARTVELGAPAPRATSKPTAPRHASKPAAPRAQAFKLQFASAKSAAGAAKEARKLRVRYAAQLAEVRLAVEKAPRGGLYRVVSQPLAERAAARDVCAALAAQRGSCLVVATRGTPAGPAPAARTLVAAKTPAAAVPVRAQLASLRSLEGATRELERLTRRYADVLDHASLTISRIDQGDRGTFYRVLTGPLPDRGAASGLCQRIALLAGCVLIRDRHREARLTGPGAAAAAQA